MSTTYTDSESQVQKARQAYKAVIKDCLPILKEGSNYDDEAKRGALLTLHDSGVAFFNAFERELARVHQRRERRDPVWYTDKVESSVNMLETIAKHFDRIFFVAKTVGFERSMFMPSRAAYANMQRLVVDTASAQELRSRFVELGLPTQGFDVNYFKSLSSTEKILAAIIGTLFLVILIALAIFVPNPTDFQFFVFRVILALAAAAIGGILSGFLRVTSTSQGMAIRAGGGFALFIVIYLLNPPALIDRGVDSGGVRPEASTYFEDSEGP